MEPKNVDAESISKDSLEQMLATIPPQGQGMLDHKVSDTHLKKIARALVNWKSVCTQLGISESEEEEGGNRSADELRYVQGKEQERGWERRGWEMRGGRGEVRKEKSCSMIRSIFVGFSDQYQCFLHTVTVWVGIQNTLLAISYIRDIRSYCAKASSNLVSEFGHSLKAPKNGKLPSRM